MGGRKHGAIGVGANSGAKANERSTAGVVPSSDSGAPSPADKTAFRTPSKNILQRSLHGAVANPSASLNVGNTRGATVHQSNNSSEHPRRQSISTRRHSFSEQTVSKSLHRNVTAQPRSSKADSSELLSSPMEGPMERRRLSSLGSEHQHQRHGAPLQRTRTRSNSSGKKSDSLGYWEPTASTRGMDWDIGVDLMLDRSPLRMPEPSSRTGTAESKMKPPLPAAVKKNAAPSHLPSSLIPASVSSPLLDMKQSQPNSEAETKGGKAEKSTNQLSRRHSVSGATIPATTSHPIRSGPMPHSTMHVSAPSILRTATQNNLTTRARSSSLNVETATLSPQTVELVRLASGTPDRSAPLPLRTIAFATPFSAQPSSVITKESGCSASTCSSRSSSKCTSGNSVNKPLESSGFADEVMEMSLSQGSNASAAALATRDFDAQPSASTASHMPSKGNNANSTNKKNNSNNSGSNSSHNKVIVKQRAAAAGKPPIGVKLVSSAPSSQLASPEDDTIPPSFAGKTAAFLQLEENTRKPPAGASTGVFSDASTMKQQAAYAPEMHQETQQHPHQATATRVSSSPAYGGVGTIRTVSPPARRSVVHAVHRITSKNHPSDDLTHPAAVPDKVSAVPSAPSQRPSCEMRERQRAKETGVAPADGTTAVCPECSTAAPDIPRAPLPLSRRGKALNPLESPAADYSSPLSEEFGARCVDAVHPAGSKADQADTDESDVACESHTRPPSPDTATSATAALPAADDVQAFAQPEDAGNSSPVRRRPSYAKQSHRRVSGVRLSAAALSVANSSTMSLRIPDHISASRQNIANSADVFASKDSLTRVSISIDHERVTVGDSTATMTPSEAQPRGSDMDTANVMLGSTESPLFITSTQIGSLPTDSSSPLGESNSPSASRGESDESLNATQGYPSQPFRLPDPEDARYEPHEASSVKYMDLKRKAPTPVEAVDPVATSTSATTGAGPAGSVPPISGILKKPQSLSSSLSRLETQLSAPSSALSSARFRGNHAITVVGNLQTGKNIPEKVDMREGGSSGDDDDDDDMEESESFWHLGSNKLFLRVLRKAQENQDLHLQDEMTVAPPSGGRSCSTNSQGLSARGGLGSFSAMDGGSNSADTGRSTSSKSISYGPYNPKTKGSATTSTNELTPLDASEETVKSRNGSETSEAYLTSSSATPPPGSMHARSGCESPSPLSPRNEFNSCVASMSDYVKLETHSELVEEQTVTDEFGHTWRHTVISVDELPCTRESSLTSRSLPSSQNSPLTSGNSRNAQPLSQASPVASSPRSVTFAADVQNYPIRSRAAISPSSSSQQSSPLQCSGPTPSRPIISPRTFTLSSSSTIQNSMAAAAAAAASASASQSQSKVQPRVPPISPSRQTAHADSPSVTLDGGTEADRLAREALVKRMQSCISRLDSAASESDMVSDNDEEETHVDEPSKMFSNLCGSALKRDAEASHASKDSNPLMDNAEDEKDEDDGECECGAGEEDGRRIKSSDFDSDDDELTLTRCFDKNPCPLGVYTPRLVEHPSEQNLLSLTVRSESSVELREDALGNTWQSVTTTVEEQIICSARREHSRSNSGCFNNGNWIIPVVSSARDTRSPRSFTFNTSQSSRTGSVSTDLKSSLVIATPRTEKQLVARRGSPLDAEGDEGCVGEDHPEKCDHDAVRPPLPLSNMGGVCPASILQQPSPPKARKTHVSIAVQRNPSLLRSVARRSSVSSSNSSLGTETPPSSSRSTTDISYEVPSNMRYALSRNFQRKRDPLNSSSSSSDEDGDNAIGSRGNSETATPLRKTSLVKSGTPLSPDTAAMRRTWTNPLEEEAPDAEDGAYEYVNCNIDTDRENKSACVNLVGCCAADGTHPFHGRVVSNTNAALLHADKYLSPRQRRTNSFDCNNSTGSSSPALTARSEKAFDEEVCVPTPRLHLPLNALIAAKQRSRSFNDPLSDDQSGWHDAGNAAESPRGTPPRFHPRNRGSFSTDLDLPPGTITATPAKSTPNLTSTARTPRVILFSPRVVTIHGSPSMKPADFLPPMVLEKSQNEPSSAKPKTIIMSRKANPSSDESAPLSQ